jgi:dCMP deaminase
MSLTENIENLTLNLNERIDWDTYFMSIAFLISSRSSCDRLHVGCVLVKETRIISVGYNGFLPKTPHTSFMRDGHEIATVHAEQNAISDCARRGVDCNDCSAYVTHYPCINCAKILIASGIKNIIYNNVYNNDPIVEELAKLSKITIKKM